MLGSLQMQFSNLDKQPTLQEAHLDLKKNEMDLKNQNN